MFPRRITLALGLSLVTLAGCGGDARGGAGEPVPVAGDAAEVQDFPAASSLSLEDLETRYPAQLSLGIGASVFRRGSNRVPFVVLDKGARPITNADVALYTVRQDGSRLRGPFLARDTPFGVTPRFRAENAAENAPSSFYAADVTLTSERPVDVFALVRMDGRLLAAAPAPLGVSGRAAGDPPDVGEPAVRVHTQTVEDVRDVSKLTTRNPPNTAMLRHDFADVVGRRPSVLVFATSSDCRSRVCGPVVDVAEQVRAEVGDDVAFVHQEVFRDNEPAKGVRPQLRRWRLASEPWVFVVDRRGRVAARFEGAVSVGELREAVEKVI